MVVGIDYGLPLGGLFHVLDLVQGLLLLGGFGVHIVVGLLLGGVCQVMDISQGLLLVGGFPVLDIAKGLLLNGVTQVPDLAQGPLHVGAFFLELQNFAKVTPGGGPVPSVRHHRRALSASPGNRPGYSPHAR